MTLAGPEYTYEIIKKMNFKYNTTRQLISYLVVGLCIQFSKFIFSNFKLYNFITLNAYYRITDKLENLLFEGLFSINE